jgi:hypothetical protein
MTQYPSDRKAERLPGERGTYSSNRVNRHLIAYREVVHANFFPDVQSWFSTRRSSRQYIADLESDVLRMNRGLQIFVVSVPAVPFVVWLVARMTWETGPIRPFVNFVGFAVIVGLLVVSSEMSQAITLKERLENRREKLIRKGQADEASALYRLESPKAWPYCALDRRS